MGLRFPGCVFACFRAADQTEQPRTDGQAPPESKAAPKLPEMELPALPKQQQDGCMASTCTAEQTPSELQQLRQSQWQQQRKPSPPQEASEDPASEEFVAALEDFQISFSGSESEDCRQRMPRSKASRLKADDNSDLDLGPASCSKDLGLSLPQPNTLMYVPHPRGSSIESSGKVPFSESWQMMLVPPPETGRRSLDNLVSGRAAVRPSVGTMHRLATRTSFDDAGRTGTGIGGPPPVRTLTESMQHRHAQPLSPTAAPAMPDRRGVSIDGPYQWSSSDRLRCGSLPGFNHVIGAKSISTQSTSLYVSRHSGQGIALALPDNPRRVSAFDSAAATLMQAVAISGYDSSCDSVEHSSSNSSCRRWANLLHKALPEPSANAVPSRPVIRPVPVLACRQLRHTLQQMQESLDRSVPTPAEFECEDTPGGQVLSECLLGMRSQQQQRQLQQQHSASHTLLHSSRLSKLIESASQRYGPQQA